MKWPKEGQQQQRWIGKPSPPNPPKTKSKKEPTPSQGGGFHEGPIQRIPRIVASYGHCKDLEHHIAAFAREEDTEEMPALLSARTKAGQQGRIPPVDQPIRAMKEFIARARKRMPLHAAAARAAQEALRKTELVKQTELGRRTEAEEAFPRPRVQGSEVPSSLPSLRK